MNCDCLTSVLVNVSLLAGCSFLWAFDYLAGANAFKLYVVTHFLLLLLFMVDKVRKAILNCLRVIHDHKIVKYKL